MKFTSLYSRIFSSNVANVEYTIRNQRRSAGFSTRGSTDSIKISSDRHKSQRYVVVALVISKPGIIAVSIASFVLWNYQFYYYLEKSTIIQTFETHLKII